MATSATCQSHQLQFADVVAKEWCATFFQPKVAKYSLEAIEGHVNTVSELT